MTTDMPAAASDAFARTGRPTIYDVALACGVSTSTVSRVFGNPNRVSAVMRERVEAAAVEVGYTPRPLARVEAPGRSRTLTLVVSDIANPYYASLIKSAEAQARAHNYTLVLTDSDESPRVEAENLRHVLAMSRGGILATSRLSDETIRALARHRPLVVVNRRIEGLPSVVADTANGMRAAVRHLAGLGHRQLAYLYGPRNSWANVQRWRAVRDEAAALGLPVRLLGPFTPDQQGGREAAGALTRAGVGAAVAYNDLIALGALRQLQRHGIRVPEQLSLIGCDDIAGADMVAPALTTIGGPTGVIGRSAVDLLHAAVAGGRATPASLRFETQLIVRGSTGPAGTVATGGN
ncbi:LacI family DNA-binding transcriptional regulator [Dactylosporangium salmoneum]|uniref:LacI family DNA-binding transcriptional regulator n=1 Tax=Dactylosporangium salmoneum TaxID=53361 RepID=A0ABP5UUV0_9ACTN